LAKVLPRSASPCVTTFPNDSREIRRETPAREIRRRKIHP